MDGQGVGVESSQVNMISSGVPAIAAGAICYSCGYPTMQPGLCAYCRPTPLL